MWRITTTGRCRAALDCASTTPAALGTAGKTSTLAQLTNVLEHVGTCGDDLDCGGVRATAWPRRSADGGWGVPRVCRRRDGRCGGRCDRPARDRGAAVRGLAWAAAEAHGGTPGDGTRFPSSSYRDR